LVLTHMHIGISVSYQTFITYPSLDIKNVSLDVISIVHFGMS